MLIFGHQQLVSVLAEYADHHNVHRPHRPLGQVPPLGHIEWLPSAGWEAAPAADVPVVRLDRLGGLIYEYAWSREVDGIFGTHRFLAGWPPGSPAADAGRPRAWKVPNRFCGPCAAR
jgi:hypothetical protein